MTQAFTDWAAGIIANRVNSAAGRQDGDAKSDKGEREGLTICGLEVPVVMTSLGASLAVAGEAGNLFVIDWQGKSVFAYNYVSMGVGPSLGPAVFGSVEVGALGAQSLDQLEGWGWAANAALAAGLEGASFQYSSNFDLDYRLVTGGWAFGAGASASAMVSYTRADGVFSFSNVPEPVSGLLSACQPAGE